MSFQILAIEGSEVLTLNVCVFNGNTVGEKYEDMNNVDLQVKVGIGKIKVTFLNKFVADLLVSWPTFFFKKLYYFVIIT